MKMYIKNFVSETKHIHEKYVIDVCYEIVPYPGYVSVDTEIMPINLQNGMEQTLADYNAFIDNIQTRLINRFEIVEIEEIPRSKTSWYFYLYAKNLNDNISTKFLIRLHLLDREYSKRHNARKERGFVERKAQEYKRPKEKLYQEWKIKQIIVNNKKYFSYDDAEDAIYDELEEYSKKIFNKGN